MTDPDLVQFVDAQAQVYGRVIEELTDERKRTHWMWFIFPQLIGLGHSALAQRYAIRDLEQARRYQADPMADHQPHTITQAAPEQAIHLPPASDRGP